MADGRSSQWLFLDMTPDVLQRYEENYNTYSKSTNVAEFLEEGDGSDGDLDFPPESLLPDWLDIDVSCRTIEGLLEDYRVRVIKRVSTDGVSVYYGNDMGDVFDDTAAVCIRKDGERFWKWVDLFQWSYDDWQFEWKAEEMLIA
ncbi:hypothetical protein J3458_018967 [Metarhizium acridum]|uniref:Uncharacterized protein n=1 Tax=Metarhizium acridum (strain CQMa 102) TaxID=655827 RepID=E9DWE5_METAQ|nr:uncharacterized protein MAC_01943 [Metarhizium acridum CQMa 102]EFY91995.1 hypothetical protein MAC_01943 [Metarhizium acridum CQMa 102]KAG8409887.1 hypothetical protein J3458_018967 [Metarhizium acridum]